MRWFKHLATAQRDPDMQLLLIEHGYEGYGVYWSILEILSEHLNGGSETTLTLPMKTWKICSISDGKWTRIVQDLVKNSKISASFSGKVVTIACPKLLKYRDEYKRKLDKRS